MGRRQKDMELQIDDIGGTMTLGDLRWLVAQCEGLDDGSRIDVKGPRTLNQFDRDPAVIKVRGPIWPE